MRAGMRPDEYWDSTFGEITAFLKAAGDRAGDRLDLAVVGAYKQVAFSWKKRLPPLEDLLRHSEEERDLGANLTAEQRKGLADRQLLLWDRFYARHNVKPTVH